MPLLSSDDLKRMHEQPGRTCQECKSYVFKNYCRQCDEFFESGHSHLCSAMLDKDARNNHLGHRTY